MTVNALTFETMTRQVRVSGVVSAKTAVHVGMGRDAEPHTPDLPIIRDSDGRPFIPGSSLKGVLRSRTEALVRGYAAGQGARSCCLQRVACLITSDRELCVTADDKKGLIDLKLPDDEYTNKILAQTCLACRVFGSPWYAAKFRVADLALLPECEVQSEVRNGVAIDRDTGTSSDGQLYQLEVAPRGSRFILRIGIDNPSDEELGIGLIALELLRGGDITVGGGASRGLGVLGSEEMTFTEFAPSTDAGKLAAWLVNRSGGADLSEDARKTCIEKSLGQVDVEVQKCTRCS